MPLIFSFTLAVLNLKTSNDFHLCFGKWRENAKIGHLTLQIHFILWNFNIICFRDNLKLIIILRSYLLSLVSPMFLLRHFQKLLLDNILSKTADIGKKILLLIKWILFYENGKQRFSMILFLINHSDFPTDWIWSLVWANFGSFCWKMQTQFLRSV